MKTTQKVPLALILAGSLCPATAQDTLTPVLEGDIAEDTGYFWGCAWGDYDQDGNVDLFVCNSVTSGSVTNRLYHNNGNGTFTRVTTGTPVNERADSDAAV
ncbi:MAG: FG-GAP repeat domain-containing protein [Verrucomicrobiia bacterium]